MSRLEELPERIQRHLKSITASSGLPPGDESLERITENWLEKRRLFREQTALLEMRGLDTFDVADPRGVLLLTYSGSLVSLGPPEPGGAEAGGPQSGGPEPGGGGPGQAGVADRANQPPPARRRFEYASITLRADVPDLVREEAVRLAEPLHPDAPARFADSSIEKSSPVLHLVACDPEVPVEDQKRRIREATIFLTNGFVKLNRTLSVEGGEIEHFTTKSMVQYVAKKNEITQARARQIIDDFLITAEAGALLGERVPLGRLGKLYLGERGPQKARMGRNPATGEEMMIPAKPAVAVPKMTFSKHLRERAEASEARGDGGSAAGGSAAGGEDQEA